MKKIFVGCLSVMMLASCNVKNSEEYKQLQVEKDSLAQLNLAANAELSDMMSVIDEVESNFSQIREAEKYLTVESKSKGEVKSDVKVRIKDDFQMINDLLKKNKESLSALNKKISSSQGDVSGLKKIVERLNGELTERAKVIDDLRTSLAARDKQIAELETSVKALEGNVGDLTAKTEEQSSKIKEQDKELNTAYYMFGTSKELKEAKVVTGGFLSSTKVLNEGIDKNKFVTIDIRKTTEIPVYAKKAKVLSDHPKDSYKFEKDATGNMVLKIADYTRFWSLGKFLIIEVG